MVRKSLVKQVLQVLESQTLTRLSASCCTIDLGRRKKEVAPCFTLKSFNLSGVTVNDDFFNDLSWRFPLIEELTLKQPASLLALDAVGAMVKLQKLKSLRVESLQLDWFDIRDSFSKHELWPQFPCLKELVLIQDFAYSFCNGIRIFSPSLERIVIILCRAHGNVNAEFDVPNIRYLKLGCVGFPRLKFETTMMMSREWVLDLEISHWDREATSLKQFVQALSCVSRVSLHIDMELGYINWREGYVGDEYDGSGVAAVENLTLQNVRVTSAFLDDLSRCCRPNFIYIERNKLWDVEGKALRQLRRLPWKTNASSSVNPRSFQPKFFNDLEDLFAVREGRTLSDAEFVRFELRQLKKKQKKQKKKMKKKKKEKKRRRYW